MNLESIWLIAPTDKARYLTIIVGSKTKLPPQKIIDGGVIQCSDEKTHFVGERRIWVLWRRKRHGEKLSMYYMYYGFADYPVDSLKRVKKDIKDIINEGIAD